MCQGITKKNKQCRNRTEPYCYLHVDQQPEVKIPTGCVHAHAARSVTLEGPQPEVKIPEVKIPEVKVPEAKSHGEYPTDILNIIMDYHQGTKDDFKLKFNNVIDDLKYLDRYFDEKCADMYNMPWAVYILYRVDRSQTTSIKKSYNIIKYKTHDPEIELFCLPPINPQIYDYTQYPDENEDDNDDVTGALARLGLL